VEKRGTGTSLLDFGGTGSTISDHPGKEDIQSQLFTN
jgi:hypothetical protein